MSGEDRPYITCRELLDFLDSYLENELPEDRRAEFDRHVDVCPACRAYIRQYGVAIRLAPRAFEPSEHEEAPEELIEAILRARGR
ncbi:MAG TPA: zf-HC2 domain-containing protein [Thermoanaerobaculia bacterium]|jgi:anti-sigma factor RsiW